MISFHIQASPLRTRVMALIFEHPNQISRANNLDLVTLLMVLLTKTNFTCLIALKDLLSEKQLKSLSSLPFQWKVKGDHLFVVLFNEAGFPIAEGCNIAVSYEVVRRAHERVRLLVHLIVKISFFLPFPSAFLPPRNTIHLPLQRHCLLPSPFPFSACQLISLPRL